LLYQFCCNTKQIIYSLSQLTIVAKCGGSYQKCGFWSKKINFLARNPTFGQKKDFGNKINFFENMQIPEKYDFTTVMFRGNPVDLSPQKFSDVRLVQLLTIYRTNRTRPSTMTSKWMGNITVPSKSDSRNFDFLTKIFIFPKKFDFPPVWIELRCTPIDAHKGLFFDPFVGPELSADRESCID